MKTILLLVAVFTTAHAYNILCVFPIPSRSHNLLGRGIVNALLKAGHQVTWTSPYPELVKNPPEGLRVIDVSGTKQYANNADPSKPRSPMAGLAFVKAFANNVTKEVITNRVVREAIIHTQYDAVVSEAFFTDAMAGIAAVQQVPWLVLTGMQLAPDLEAVMDEVRSITTVPIMFNDCSIPMGFWGRLFNTFLYTAMSVVSWLDTTTSTNFYKELFASLAEARGVPLPALAEAKNNVSVLFVNTHESLSPPFSTPPNVVNVAGYHIDEEVPPLPKDLQDLLDGSPQGVVYFSMGSVLRSAALQDHTRRDLLKQFATLKQTVLWKFEADIEGLPPNVHVRPWMPQPSVLAHPNVRVFITHGGILSTMEAIKAGVPLLAVPVFGDQPANAERAVRAGYARRVRFSEDMADELAENLKEMLADDTYSKKVKELSIIFRARPVAPAKLISHYVELAIKTKGAYHLRSLSKLYPWYQRWMLDQLAFVIIVLFITVKLVLISLRACCRRSAKSTQSAVNQKKKKR